jgi:hypothetical protein
MPMLRFSKTAGRLRALPRTRAEWRAARAERAAEARIRAERDYVHHGEKIRAAAEARQQRDVSGGPWGG